MEYQRSTNAALGTDDVDVGRRHGRPLDHPPQTAVAARMIFARGAVRG